MIKVILLDLFATLTNGDAFPEKTIVEEFDLKIDMDEMERIFFGTKFIDLDSYFAQTMNEAGIEDTEDNRKKLLKIFEEDIAREKIEDEVEDVLKELLSKGYELSLISSICFPLYDLPEKKGIKKYFKMVLYSYEEGMTKQNPKFFDMALEKLGVDGNEILMVGDSINRDIKNAKRLGMKTVLIDRKNKHPNYPEPKISNLREIFDFL